MTIQRDRYYKLILGDYKTGDGLLITDLQMSFDIVKSSDNSKQTNSASIEVTNFSKETLKVLETDYLASAFYLGYQSRENTKLIFGGQVTNVTTRKSGTDKTTQLLLGTSYTELNNEVISKIVPAGRTVKDVCDELVKAFPNIKRGVYNGTNLNSKLINGYPLSGTLKQELNRLASTYRLDWNIEGDALYVHNSDRPNNENFTQAVVVSPSSGLIEVPYYTSGAKNKIKNDPEKKQGVQFQTLINPDIEVGGIIKLEDTDITGWFKVDTVRYSGSYRGGDWLQEVYCTAIEKVEKKTTTTANIPELLRRR